MAPKDFFAKYGPWAMDSQNATGIPASITLAQAALESGWGESGLAKIGNNFFGIKDQANDEWKGDFIEMKTGEVFNGVPVTINAKFRKYSNPGQSFKDHGSFLQKNRRYANLFKISFSDPQYWIKWAQGLKAAGYATATNYDGTLINIIQKYNLTEWDKKAIKKKELP